jgi:hypothetical protein
MAAMPLPDGPLNPDGLTAPLTVGYSDPASLNAYSLRIDHTINKRLSLFGRYNHAPSTEWSRYWAENLDFVDDFDSATVGATFASTSGILNDFRANWSRNTGGHTTVLEAFHGAVPPPDSAMYPPGNSSSTSQFVFVPPFATAGEVRSGPQEANVQQQLNFVDNLSVTVGRHQLKFGADFRHLNPSTHSNNYDLLVIANSYSSLQAGIADTVNTVGGSPITAAINNYSFFGQDIWKVSPRLTFTYGLRWEINTPMRSITPGKPLYAVRGIFDSQPFGLAPAGTPLWHTRFDNFAPRVGVAFQLSPQTVFRGAFGRYYDLGYGDGLGGTMVNFPYYVSNSVYGSTPFDFSNPAFRPPTFTLVPSQETAYIDAVDPHLKVPFTYEWNMAVERGLGSNQSVSATYVGAHGENLLREDRILSTVGYQTLSTRNADWSNYNALQLQFHRRMARGLQALVSYTFAKSTDTGSDDADGTDTTSLSKVNVAADLGPSLFDVRNSFSAAASWQIPSPHWGRLGDALLRNWQTDGIVRISSAPPFDVTLIGRGPLFYYTRPDIVPGVPFYLPAPGQPGGRTLNRNAFAVPPSGQQGDLPRNYFRGFPIAQTDLALRRQFHLTERATLSFGAEYFNLFNHPMFGFGVNIFNANLRSPSFGQVTDTLNEDLGGLNPLYQIGGPRSGQLMIKVLF